jgi:pyrroloquinoline quinone biosynthesis protein B
MPASPDLRVQIEAAPELWPQKGIRHSPVGDVILPSAEVDNVVGLLSLREFHSFRVHATASVRRILTENNNLFNVLARFPGQVRWEDIPADRPFPAAGARLEALPLPGSFPGFVRASTAKELNPADATIGLVVSPESGGSEFAFLPGVDSISDELLERLQSCKVILFDGTFWSEDEPLRIPGISRTARQMGHVPIGGRDGSLECFRKLQGPRKIYIHINNTNPILDEESIEYQMVRESGWEVARDGMEIAL